jgi:hypothetical protein
VQLQRFWAGDLYDFFVDDDDDDDDDDDGDDEGEGEGGGGLNSYGL